MHKVLIMTDSTSDLSKEMLSEYHIVSIPLYVKFNDEIYKDGVTLQTEELYEKIKEKKLIPKTSAVQTIDFIHVFERYLKIGYDILYIGISSKISQTHQAAMLAIEEIDHQNRIFIVDSLNLSSGIALLVMKAKDLRDAGFSAKEIKDKIDHLVFNVSSQLTLSNLDYFYKAKRISKLFYYLARLLSMKPVMKVKDGKLKLYKRPMGDMTKAIDIMIDDYVKAIPNLDLDYVFVTHSLANRQAIYMMNRIKQATKPIHLIENQAGCVISSHTGAKAIGLCYLLKDQIEDT